MRCHAVRLRAVAFCCVHCDPELHAALCLRQVKHGAHQGAGEQHAAARRKGGAHKEEKGLVLDGKLLVQKEQVRKGVPSRNCAAWQYEAGGGLVPWACLRRRHV